MFLKRLLVVVSSLCLLLSLAGCGDDSMTNGTMSLNASATTNGAGVADLTASAIVTASSSNGSLVGEKVTFVATHYGYNSTTGLYEVIETYSPPSTPIATGGVATMPSHAFAQSQVMATAIQVTATCRGLSQSMTLPVAKYVPAP